MRILNKLYVGNLQWGVTDEELGQFFSQAGEIVSAEIIVDRDTGRSRGFGFVEMRDEKGFRKALKLHDEDLNGRMVLVREAKPEGGHSPLPVRSPEPASQPTKPQTNEVIEAIDEFVSNKSVMVGEEMSFTTEDRHYVLKRDK